MFMTVLFFGLGSLAQLSSSHFKMLATFLLTLKFWIKALHDYNDTLFNAALNQLLIVGLITAGCELLFLFVPFGLGGPEL